MIYVMLSLIILSLRSQYRIGGLVLQVYTFTVCSLNTNLNNSLALEGLGDTITFSAPNTLLS